MTLRHSESGDSFWGKETKDTEREGGKEAAEAEKGKWRWGKGEGGRARGGGQVGVGGSAPGLPYLHEGSQDLPGFLVELLSIPLRVESL